MANQIVILPWRTDHKDACDQHFKRMIEARVSESNDPNCTVTALENRELESQKRELGSIIAKASPSDRILVAIPCDDEKFAQKSPAIFRTLMGQLKLAQAPLLFLGTADRGFPSAFQATKPLNMIPKTNRQLTLEKLPNPEKFVFDISGWHAGGNKDLLTWMNAAFATPIPKAKA